MGLVLWMPCTKDLHNQGLVGTNPTGTCTYEAGKIGNCAKVTSTIDTGLSSDKWDYSTKSISFGGWFKFNKAEMQAAVLNKNTNTKQTFASFNLLGKDSYNGFALSLYTNNIYNPTADLTSLNIQAHMRSSTTSWSRSFGTIEWDTWIHLFITWDFDSKTFTTYKNGAKVNSYTISNWGGDFTYRGAFNIADNAIFGGNGPVVIMPFRVNDVRVYDHCLSPKEVKEIAKGLVLHYPLNDIYNGSYNLLNDSDTFTNWGDYEAGYTEIKINEFGRKSLIITNKRSWCGAKHSVQIPSAGTYTISCYCKPISRTKTSIKQTLYISGNGLNDQHVKVDWNKTNQWQRLSLTCTYNQAGSFFVYLIAYGGSRTDDYKVTCEYTMPQVTKTDTTVPYVEKSIPDLTVYDCSGYQNNGTISGALSCSADSPRYKISTVFDGTSAKIINESFPTSIVNGTNPFTICGWAYCIKGNSYYPLFHIGSNYRTPTGICLHGDGNRIEVLDINGTKIDNTYGSGYSNEKWVHQCIVYDGTTIKRYLNGNNTPIQSIACPGFKSDNNKLSVGGFWGSTFKGYLSDFRIYATALSADDIKELYNTSAYVSDNGTLLTYNLEE